MTTTTIQTSQLSQRKVAQRLREAAQNYRQNESLQGLIRDLRNFEETYHLSTVEFYPRYIAGLLSDDRDYLAWASIYEAYVELTQPQLMQSTVA